MKNKFKIILTAMMLLSIYSFAQSNLQDVVYLKNGSIIRGLVIEQAPNVSIKIQTGDRNIFVYKVDEIEKITKEENIYKGKNVAERQTFSPGYKGILDAGYQIGTGLYGMDRIKLNYINSVQINPLLSIGIGTGLNYYTDADALLVPLYGDFRFNFLDNNTSPYLSFAIGYSFDATNRFKGTGLLISPAAGVIFKVSDKSAINLSLGYDMQKMDFGYLYYNSNSYNYFTSKQNSGAISINFGVSF